MTHSLENLIGPTASGSIKRIRNLELARDTIAQRIILEAKPEDPRDLTGIPYDHPGLGLILKSLRRVITDQNNVLLQALATSMKKVEGTNVSE